MGMAGYSTAGFTDRSLEDALEAIARAGFRQVEILGRAPHLEHPPGGKGASELRRRLESLRFVETTVHAPMGKNVLGAPEEEWRREVAALFTGFIRLAARIEATGLVIHPVPNPCFVPDPDAPDMAQRIGAAARRSLDDLAPIAERDGVRILLENLPYDCPYPFLGVEQLQSLVGSYPEHAVGLVVDTGHAWTARRSPADEIRLAGDRLGGVHLQDVDGAEPNDNHWAPTHGDLDWDAIRAALVQMEYHGPWTFEVIRPRHAESPEAMAALCRSLADNWRRA